MRETDSINVDQLAKVVPIALVGTYFAGFIAVSRHLAHYGITSLDLFRLQYLIAGTWCIVIIVAYFSVTLMGNAFLEIAKYVYRTPARTRYSNYRHLSIVIAHAVPSILFIVVFRRRAVSFSALLFLLFIFYSLEVLYRVLLWTRSYTPSPASLNLSRMGWFTIALACLCYVVFFGLNIYPSLPSSLGGGKPQSVVFQLHTPRDPDSLFLGKDSGGRTVPYDLLFETQDSYVVISPNDKERSIELNKKLVVAMIALKQ